MNETSARPDLRQRVGGRFLRLLNPLVCRMVSAGVPTGAPNILLTVRGRRSGKARTVPVGMVELDGRRFVQASYGETGWVRNLRAAGEATVTDGDRRVPVRAVELAPDQGGAILRRALEPYRARAFFVRCSGPASGHLSASSGGVGSASTTLWRSTSRRRGATRSSSSDPWPRLPAEPELTDSGEVSSGGNTNPAATLRAGPIDLAFVQLAEARIGGTLQRPRRHHPPDHDRC
jgi:deazaflavin-dependent oxidoreductase (nitroreductase family)